MLIPARFTAAEEREWVEAMLNRLARPQCRADDGDLAARATALSSRYLGGLAKPSSVRWVDNQGARWGSCTPADGSIRISRRVAEMPAYVLDYVLLHELAHLIIPRHGRDFWALLAGYPRLERARGYLDGVAAAGDVRGAAGEPPGDIPEDVVLGPAPTPGGDDGCLQPPPDR